MTRLGQFLLNFKIAYRYFRSNKSVQAIHYISYISTGAVIVLSASMIILLSVFNGFESLLTGLYKGFYPDIKITADKSKWLDLSQEQIDQIYALDAIESVSKSAEDMILIFKEDVQKVAVLKGVENTWFDATDFDTFIIDGAKRFDESSAHAYQAIVGVNIASSVGININDPFTRTELYYPREYQESISLEQSLNSIDIMPTAEFMVQAEIDGRYILVPLQAAQSLFDNENKISSIEMKIKPNADIDKVIASIQNIVGADVKVLSQYEQNKTIYMVMNLEKLATYIILTFILIIASFTLVGVISMMALDKKKDLNILRAMGLPAQAIQSILIIYGTILSFFGGIMGLIIGILVCKGQQTFGWIKMEPGFVIENYPVELRFIDIAIVLLIVIIVGILASILPALRIRRQKMEFIEE